MVNVQVLVVCDDGKPAGEFASAAEGASVENALTHSLPSISLQYAFVLGLKHGGVELRSARARQLRCGMIISVWRLFFDPFTRFPVH